MSTTEIKKAIYDNGKLNIIIINIEVKIIKKKVIIVLFN